MFKLPKLKGTTVPNEKYIIYFSCDYDYFDRHGYALQQSINRTVSFVHVHCHIINEGNMDQQILDSLSKKFKFSYSYEDVNETFYKDLPKNKLLMADGIDIFKTDDINYIARRTYLASVRFMRLSELFTDPEQFVLQVDCDSILRNGFHLRNFIEITKEIGVMPKPKDERVFIASALSLGTSQKGLEWRKLFADNLKKGFEKGCYWFIDQEILRTTMTEWKKKGNEYTHIPYKWNAWGIKKDDIFSTGKGRKKEEIKFKLAQMNWLPKHWYDIVHAELIKSYSEEKTTMIRKNFKR